MVSSFFLSLEMLSNFCTTRRTKERGGREEKGEGNEVLLTFHLRLLS